MLRPILAQLSTRKCEKDNAYEQYVVPGHMMSVEHLSALAWQLPISVAHCR